MAAFINSVTLLASIESNKAFGASIETLLVNALHIGQMQKCTNVQSYVAIDEHEIVVGFLNQKQNTLPPILVDID